LAAGIGSEHVPELIRMATDENLNNTLSDSPEVWAPLHAWRTLGKLRAESAIEPLLTLFRRIDEQDDEWVLEDLPQAIGEIGVPALPALSACLADNSRKLGAREAAAISVKEIGRLHPESRSQCVAILSDQLGKSREKGRSLNGAIVSLLLDLEAIEAAPCMEPAFAAGLVDESVAGDWEDVQIELGLKENRATSAKFTAFPPLRRMAESGCQSPVFNNASFPDLRAINKAQKKARSEAKKAKWKRMLQRQRRK
jgi:hypothetical protein